LQLRIALPLLALQPPNNCGLPPRLHGLVSNFAPDKPRSLSRTEDRFRSSGPNRSAFKVSLHRLNAQI
jgi:hypothetical protein